VEGWQVPRSVTHYRFTYDEIMPDAEAAAVNDWMHDDYYEQVAWFESIKDDFPDDAILFLEEFPSVDDYVNQGKIDGYAIKKIKKAL